MVPFEFIAFLLEIALPRRNCKRMARYIARQAL